MFVFPALDICMFDHDGCCYVLKKVPFSNCKGNNTIFCCGDLFDKTCAVIPFDKSVSIKSQGLKWNLDGSYSFSTFISTSNERISDVIE